MPGEEGWGERSAEGGGGGRGGDCGSRGGNRAGKPRETKSPSAPLEGLHKSDGCFVTPKKARPKAGLVCVCLGFLVEIVFCAELLSGDVLATETKLLGVSGEKNVQRCQAALIPHDLSGCFVGCCRTHRALVVPAGPERWYLLASCWRVQCCRFFFLVFHAAR